MGWGGGPCWIGLGSLDFVVPCSVKYAFVSRVPSFIFPLFPCSLKVNCHVPLFPKTPGGAQIRVY